MKRGLLLLFLMLAACAQREPGKAIELPESYVQQPILPVEEKETVMPSPTPDKECLFECGKSLQLCRRLNQPQYSECVDVARGTLKNCLTTGDDAYCRFAYSKSREQCFTVYMAGCDILLNSCASKC